MGVKTAPMKLYIDVVPADDDVILKEAGNQIGLRVSPLYTCSRSAAASSQSLSTLGHGGYNLTRGVWIPIPASALRITLLSDALRIDRARGS